MIEFDVTDARVLNMMTDLPVLCVCEEINLYYFYHDENYYTYHSVLCSATSCFQDVVWGSHSILLQDSVFRKLNHFFDPIKFMKNAEFRYSMFSKKNAVRTPMISLDSRQKKSYNSEIETMEL